MATSRSDVSVDDSLRSPPPGRILSLLLDGALAASGYVAAYWLRFPSDRLAAFLPGTWSTMPVVVIGYVATLAAAGAYARRPRPDWLFRVGLGVTAGTVLVAAVVGSFRGFEGVSRSAFVAHGILMAIGALGWRAAWFLRARVQFLENARTSGNDLVSRNGELTTLRSVVRSLYGYRELLRNLVAKDLKLKYRGSAFGFAWSLLNPLLMTVVYMVAFTFILQIRGEGFVFYLMLGLLAWTFFANSAMMSTGAIVDNAGLLKSVLFPRAILPIATVLFNLAQYLLSVAVFLPVVLLWYRVPLSSPMLLFPVFLGLQVVFTIGVALMLATATAFFRDVRHLVEVGIPMLFWTTPIVYEIRHVPERLQLLILLSPMSPFVVAYEQLFFYRQWPNGSVWLAAVLGALATFVVGAVVFLTFEDQVMEQL